MPDPRPPLLLTGGPAAGKTTTARALADRTPRTAVIDVDDVRQLVRSGGVAPWRGEEGAAQQLLGVRNAAALTANFRDAGFSVVLADVVTARTLAEYRRRVPDLVVVRLRVSLDEARRRARERPVFLTDAEFVMLHADQQERLALDHDLDVDDLTADEQVQRVADLWRPSS